MEAVELAVEARLLMKTVTMDISLELQHLKQISEFSEADLQGGYHVNCVPDGSWVLCGEVLKAMWSEQLSDKCAVFINVWNKELHINVRLNQIMRLIILRNTQQHI